VTRKEKKKCREIEERKGEKRRQRQFRRREHTRHPKTTWEKNSAQEPTFPTSLPPYILSQANAPRLQVTSKRRGGNPVVEMNGWRR
jgi:hypothetical protein